MKKKKEKKLIQGLKTVFSHEKNMYQWLPSFLDMLYSAALESW